MTPSTFAVTSTDISPETRRYNAAAVDVAIPMGIPMGTDRVGLGRRHA